MAHFNAKVQRIGVNPYVRVPREVLEEVMRQAGRSKGPLAVRGRLNGSPFVQTVVKYRGVWRLYLNTAMRRAAGIDVGAVAWIHLWHDEAPRTVAMNPTLDRALARNPGARAAFEALAPSRQREILRYLGSLKAQATVDRNVTRILQRLAGKSADRLAAL